MTREADVILHSSLYAPFERTPEHGFLLLLTSMFQRRSHREIALLVLYGFFLCWLELSSYIRVFLPSGITSEFGIVIFG